MTALAPALQAFFTERLITQRNSSPETIAAYRDTFTAAAALRARADRQAAVRAGHRRSRRAADRRVPQPPRTRPGQQPQNPQRPPRGDPLLLPVRRARTPRARAHDRAGDGDPDQAPRAQHRLLPRPRRDQGAARRARPRHLARPPRPRAAGAHDPDRRARLRARRPARRRRPPRHRRPHPGPGQGTQEARHDPDRRDRRGPARMAQRTPRPARRPAVPNPPRTAAQPLHGRRARRQARRHRGRQLPVADRPSASPRTRSATPTRCCSRAKGVDIATIALWLGHESTQTTHIYEHADPALKEQAIARTAPLGAKPGRYRPSDALLAFLESL